MSRNARKRSTKLPWLVGLCGLFVLWTTTIAAPPDPPLLLTDIDTNATRAVIVHDPRATVVFEPDAAIVRAMVDRGVITWTAKDDIAKAWRHLVSTQDTVGIKVFSSPGPNTGSRPVVVAAVVEGLLQAGMPARQIVVWDKHLSDLRQAGFMDLGRRYGIRIESSAAAGYDPDKFYESPLLGQLVYGDWEFGRKEETVGRKSFVSKLVSKDITKIINITPLLNHNRAGISGNLYSLTLGSLDNTLRFEANVRRLAEAVPEIYAMPELSDRVVLNIVDALVCQYEGEQTTLLHYSAVLNEIRVSKDPVALDVLSLLELDRRRQSGDTRSSTNYLELYHNASLLQLGASDPRQIRVERP